MAYGSGGVEFVTMGEGMVWGRSRKFVEHFHPHKGSRKRDREVE